MMHVAVWWPRAALVLALAPMAQGSAAQQADLIRLTPRPQVSVQVVEQKIAMVLKVLDRSPVAARVLTSQNQHARRHLVQARELVVHAQALSDGGMLRGADALLNEAIWELSQAQQLVPDPGLQQAGERGRFTQLEDSIAALQRTALIALPSAGARQAESTQKSNARANELVEQATTLARADRYIEANKQLGQALLLLLTDASARLAGHTIIYDGRFANTREEFDFELERYRSFERLVPLALLEFRPPSEALTLINRYVAQARLVRERGEAQASQDARGAIKNVVEGTDMLKRALQAAGLVVPQTLNAE